MEEISFYKWPWLLKGIKTQAQLEKLFVSYILSIIYNTVNIMLPCNIYIFVPYFYICSMLYI